jgi:hypothetical protein
MPISTKISPGSTLNETPFKTSIAPNFFERFSTVTPTAGVSVSVKGLRVELAGVVMGEGRGRRVTSARG